MNSISIDAVIDLFDCRGRTQYGHEPVSQTEHALQAAALAEAEGAAPALVAAALLHDLGHLLHDGDPVVAGWDQDDRHETVAWRCLKTGFAPAVVEPIRLHVEAKRYLCAVEPGYLATLSAASVRSLDLQGGAHSPAEAERFRLMPFAAEAVRLRRWDDRAKIAGASTRALWDYADLLRAVRS